MVSCEPTEIISYVCAKSFISRSYESYLTSICDTHVESLLLDSVPIICEFFDVFPTDLPGVHPDPEIEFAIDFKPGTGPISMAPYHMAPGELKELNSQL